MLSGCATVFSPSADEVSFLSSPEGAEVWIDGEKVGTTPYKSLFNRQTFKNSQVTIRARGYKSQTFPLSKSFNKVALLNLTLWPSWITDALSGSMIEFAPRSYYIELTPTRPTPNPDLAADFEARTSRGLRREQVRYLLNHYEAIVKEIARGGSGEHLKNYWHVRSDELDYTTYLERIHSHSSSLLEHQNPLDLYKKMELALKEE